MFDKDDDSLFSHSSISHSSNGMSSHNTTSGNSTFSHHSDGSVTTSFTNND